MKLSKTIYFKLLFSIVFLIVVFVVVGKSSEAQAINYVGGQFRNISGYTLNIHYKLYYGPNDSACPNVNYDPYAFPDCWYLEGGERNDLTLNNGASWSGIDWSGNFPDAPYFVWWWADYINGSPCVDPTVKLDGTKDAIGFYTYNIGVVCTSPTAPSTNIIVGRIFRDDNGNQSNDEGRIFHDIGNPNSCAVANSENLQGLRINYSGPASGHTYINGCIAGAPSYQTAQIPVGTYTVWASVEPGWSVPWHVTTGQTTVSVQANSAGDRWHGVKNRNYLEGRVFKASSSNDNDSTGDQLISDPPSGSDCPGGPWHQLSGLRINYSGPVTGHVYINGCNTLPMYSTPQLPVGTYNVWASVEPGWTVGWQISTGTPLRTINLTSTNNNPDAWFGVYIPVPKANIQGDIVLDKNGNEVWDSGEVRIRNSSISCGADVPNNNFYARITGTGITGTLNGNPTNCWSSVNSYYVAVDLSAASGNSYSVTLNMPAGFTYITRTNNSVKITNGSSFSLTNGTTKRIDFFVKPYCTKSTGSYLDVTPGTNKLEGCYYLGKNFDLAAGNAEDGSALASPVADTAIAVDKNWDVWGPTPTTGDVGVDNFSVRLKGNFTFKTGIYKFNLSSDDGAKLYIDGVAKIDDWKNSNYVDPEKSVNVTFAAQGSHLITVEYYDLTSIAHIKLDWVYTNPAFTNPTNLQAAVSCSENGNQPIVTFSWTSPEYEDGLVLQLNTSAFTSDTTPTGWSQKQLSSSTAGKFYWTQIMAPTLEPPPANSESITGVMQSGSISAPAKSSTLKYYWRLQSFKGLSYGQFIYPGGTDTDGDGVLDGIVTTPPAAPGGSVSALQCQPRLRFTPYQVITVPSGNAKSNQNVSFKIESYGSGYSVLNGSATDLDGDGFSNNAEDYMGTDKYARCGPNAWPPDLNNDYTVGNADVLLLGAHQGTTDVRYDFNLSGLVTFSTAVDSEQNFTDPTADSWYLSNSTNHLYNENCNSPFEVAIKKSVAISPPPGGFINCTDEEDGAVRIAKLGPGDFSSTYSININLSDTPGTYKAVGLIDSDCELSGLVVADRYGWGDYTVTGFDLSLDPLDLVDSFVPQPNCLPTCNYQAGDTITAKVKIINKSASPSTPGYYLGVWPGQVGENPLPACVDSNGTGASVPPPTVTYSEGQSGVLGFVPSITNGTPVEITVTFNAGLIQSTPTAYAYIIPGCNLPDTNWSNNKSGGFTYNVKLDGWFETVNGDVCSGGNINTSIDSTTLSPARYQSSYLLARNGIGPTAKSGKWTLNNYSAKCVTGDVYNDFADKLLTKAKLNTITTGCQLSSSPPNTLNYINPTANGCTNSEAFMPASGTITGTKVYFIEGNFRINVNSTLSASNNAIYLVSGNIIVEKNIQKLSGIYIAGGTFRDTVDDTDIIGPQLFVDGAIYASDVQFKRKLDPTASNNCFSPPTTFTLTVISCGAQANKDNPAEMIYYDTRFVTAFNDLISSVDFDWQEVAP